jgi:Protein of unknown function (DUF2892)
VKKNMGSMDRGIRFGLAVLIGVLYFSGVIGGTLAIVLGLFAVIFVATSFIGWCPAYLPFGWSTCKVTDGQPSARA